MTMKLFSKSSRTGFRPAACMALALMAGTASTGANAWWNNDPEPEIIRVT